MLVFGLKVFWREFVRDPFRTFTCALMPPILGSPCMSLLFIPISYKSHNFRSFPKPQHVDLFGAFVGALVRDYCLGLWIRAYDAGKGLPSWTTSVLLTI